MTAVTFDSRAGAPARRQRQFKQLRYAGVLAKRNLIKLTRTPEQFIDVTLQPIIFLVLFYYVLGGALGGSLGSGALANRHGYLEFLVPGLLAQTIAMSSISIGQNMNADIEKGVFDRFRSLPIGRAIPLVGAVLAEFFRYLLVVVITIGFGYILGFRVETNFMSLLAAIGLSICFALAFAWISVWVGLKMRSAGSVQGVMMLLVLPLTFASSTFVKVSSMPGWLQAFVKVNPISHVVDAVRGLLLGSHAAVVDGVSTASAVGWTFVWIAGILVVFFPLAMRAYVRRT
jgi:oleandomycin transport system permease protein